MKAKVFFLDEWWSSVTQRAENDSIFNLFSIVKLQKKNVISLLRVESNSLGVLGDWVRQLNKRENFTTAESEFTIGMWGNGKCDFDSSHFPHASSRLPANIICFMWLNRKFLLALHGGEERDSQHTILCDDWQRFSYILFIHGGKP